MRLTKPFGIDSDVDFADTTGQTLVAGQTRLVTKSDAPEGLLFKRISNFQEAVDCGGLFLYSKTTPAKWMFIVGTTLHRVLKDNKLGIVSTIARTADDVLFKYKPVGKYAGNELGKDNSGVEQGYKTDRGGDFEIILTDVHYFGKDDVGALGVATGAEEGFGISQARSVGFNVVNGSLPNNKASTGIGYVASIIPMNAPFSTFMTKVKPALLAEVPSAIRSYYERTFNQVLAAYSGKDSKPTISINTHWVGGSIATPNMPKPILKDTAVAINGISFWAQSTHAASYKGWESVSFSGKALSNATTFDLKSTQKYRFICRAGFRGANETTHPLMEDHWACSEKVPLSSPTGLVGQLKVGVLRDGQLLKRSLVDKVLYADTPSSHADLAALVNETLDVFEFDQGALKTDATLSEATAEADLLLGPDTTGATGNIYQVGTLPLHITAFSNAWDAAAKALADQEN